MRVRDRLVVKFPEARWRWQCGRDVAEIRVAGPSVSALGLRAPGRLGTRRREPRTVEERRFRNGVVYLQYRVAM
jgi:hypothetical protein